MNDETKQAMLKIIEEKKQKSATQSGRQRIQNNLGAPQKGQKKHKKGGLFDK